MDAIGINKYVFYARKVARDKMLSTYENFSASKRKTKWGAL